MLGQSRSLHDLPAIRLVFQRLCREAGIVSLRLEGRDWPFQLLAESGIRFSLAVSPTQRTRWNLKPGSTYQLALVDRGRHYRATVKLGGWGEVDAEPCAHFFHPRDLEATDYDGLTDYVPDEAVTCMFSSPSQDICEGRLRALGNDGLEFALWGTGAVRDGQLKVGAGTTVELALDKGTRVVLAAETASIEAATAAVRFTAKADPAMLKVYRGWLGDAILAQDRKDREGFSLQGLKARRDAAQGSTGSLAGLQLLVDKDPLVLVIGEGGFAQRMAGALGRRFGVAGLDFLQGAVRPMVAEPTGGPQPWGRAKLVLVHQRLRRSSGMELTRQLTQEEHCPLPILVAGSEDDLDLKRNRAIASGAVDFLTVEPFRILAVMHALDVTLKLFC